MTSRCTCATTALDSERQPEWAPLREGRCTPTTITFRVAKTKTAVKIAGQIFPAVPGRATVTLSRRTPSGFKRLGSKPAPFDAEGLFKASFTRPASGRCKAEVRYAGDAEREPSSAVKLFAC
ncbi:MAG: hypothetical protein M3323_07195 [Actinomycetota bacterium]|nr:hypothetical protein [Actinomycetota bacterium]